MYERYIRTYIEFADVIVAGGGFNKKIVDIWPSTSTRPAAERPRTRR
jgi:hypothetical protein